MAKSAIKESTETWVIQSATLHQAVPLAGQTEKTITNKKFPGIKMTWAPQGLICDHKGRTFIVPVTNVAIAELE